MKILNNLKIVKICAFIILASASVFADSSYVVKKGDTLYSISRKYQITVPELRAANNLSENDVLKEGAKLVIPSADIGNAAALSYDSKKSSPSVSSSTKATASYTVKAGDTLYGIARKYNIKLPELLAMNSLDNGATIKVGQKITVPGNASLASVVTGSSNTSSASSAGTKSTEIKASASASSNIQGVTWPLSNPTVKNINGKVSGVLLTGKDNEAVKAVREGTVMYTGTYRGFGEVVFVQSKTGLIYSYSGLNKVTAKKGDYVVAGAELGKTGHGGDAGIKFMVFQNGSPIDPAKAPRG